MIPRGAAHLLEGHHYVFFVIVTVCYLSTLLAHQLYISNLNISVGIITLVGNTPS